MRDIENSHDKKCVACTAGLCKVTCYQGQHVFQPQNISGMKKKISRSKCIMDQNITRQKLVSNISTPG